MKMGSPFNLILVTDDSLKAADLAKRSFALVDSFNLIYSDYDSTSELSKLNMYGANKRRISPALWDILLRAREAYRKSNGTYDITVGPLSWLWRRSRKEKTFPDKKTVRDIKKLVGFTQLVMDDKQQTMTIPRAGMRLDLGGIAKGYLAQKIIDFLKTNGIIQALADAGGDMVMSNAPPSSNGWVVGINIPETTDDLLAKKLVLQNIAVATSGDAYQYMEHEGKKYSHIIDPRTGYGISSQRNVTVIAKDGAEADWLATACSILPIEDGKKLVQRMGGELLITELRNGKIIYFSTKGFTGYWK
ncbi:MAG: FAD:protein FMN transferase [Sediminibacterium sp.]